LKHFLTFLPDTYLPTKIPDMPGKNLTYGNPSLGEKDTIDHNDGGVDDFKG